MSESPRILCCPYEKIDWNHSGGLCCCNIPCSSSSSKHNLTHWYVDEDNPRHPIIVPDETILLPGWLIALPCFWINVCIMIPLMKSSAFIFTETSTGVVSLDYKIKYACFEVHSIHRNMIREVKIESGKTFFGSKTASLTLISSEGNVDKGKVTTLNNPNDMTIINQLIELIQTKMGPRGGGGGGGGGDVGGQVAYPPRGFISAAANQEIEIPIATQVEIIPPYYSENPSLPPSAFIPISSTSPLSLPPPGGKIPSAPPMI